MGDNNMYKIMLIEDDIVLSSMIKEYIEKYGYMVYEPKDFDNIEHQFDEIKPHLVLLDINLPYYDGFYICRAIRRKSSVPIIITSARSGEMDQVMAIELGADDYITKPLKLEVLLAKVKAAFRRVYGEYSLKENKDLIIGELKLDTNNFSMVYNKKSVELSKNEYKIIKKFIENKDRPISREELFEELWDDLTFVDDNTLTVNITRVKARFMELGINNIIKNKRGIGYIFDYSKLEGESNE
jgi:DNA-binding response OmpR family regulator